MSAVDQGAKLKTQKGYAVLTPYGHVSDVHMYLLFARGSCSSREDADQCKIVEVEIVIGQEVAKMETPKQPTTPAKRRKK